MTHEGVNRMNTSKQKTRLGDSYLSYQVGSNLGMKDWYTRRELVCQKKMERSRAHLQFTILNERQL